MSHLNIDNICLFKGHALYNSVGQRRPTDNKWMKKAFNAQQEFLGARSQATYEMSCAITVKLKGELLKLRNRAREKLKAVHEGLRTNPDNHGLRDEFCAQMRETSTECSEKLLKITRQIVEEAVKWLVTQPPCSFTVAAIGSLARGEATPYSDLEYIFLVEKKDKTTIQYFEDLAMVTYFIIGNLRETKLNYMAIEELEGWFDDTGMNGLKIDGLQRAAGNIPTGNGSTNSKNHFIVTPDELLTNYKQIYSNPDPIDSMKGDMTAMLTYTVEIFCFQSNDFLKRFQESKALYKANERRDIATQRMIRRDVSKHNFEPDEDLSRRGYSVDVKRHLYRYPSILLLNISILFNINATDSWDALNKLEESSKVSSSIHESLRFLLSCTCYFRLSAYLHHDSQDDRLSILRQVLSPESKPRSIEVDSDESPQVARRCHAADPGKRWYVPSEIIEIFFNYQIPMKKHLQHVDCQSVEETLASEIQPVSWIVKSQTYYHCQQFSRALTQYQDRFGEALMHQPMEVVARMEEETLTFSQFWCVVSILTWALIESREYKLALRYFSNIQNSLKEKLSEDKREFDLRSSEVLTGLGDTNMHLGNYELAEEQYSSALALKSPHLNPLDEKIGVITYTIGRANRKLRNYEKAEECTIKALRVFQINATKERNFDYYGSVIEDNTGDDEHSNPFVEETKLDREQVLKQVNNATQNTSNCLSSLGTMYMEQHMMDIAQLYFKKAYEFCIVLYGKDALHDNLSSNLLNLGNACDGLHQYEEAVDFYKRALHIRHGVYGEDASHPNIARIHYQIAWSQNNMGDYEAAHRSFTNAYQQSQKLFDNKAHSQHSGIALLFDGYGYNMLCLGRYKEGKQYIDKSLQINLKVLGSRLTRDIGNNYHHLATFFWKTGDIVSAESNFKQALHAFSQITNGNYDAEKVRADMQMMMQEHES